MIDINPTISAIIFNINRLTDPNTILRQLGMDF